MSNSLRVIAAAALLACEGSAAGAMQPDSGPNIQVNTQNTVNACLTPAEQARPIDQFTTAQRLRLITCVNAGVVRQIRTQLPIRVDEISVLVGISNVGPRVVYEYQIARAASEFPSGSGAQFEQVTRANVCANAQMRQTMSLGGSYEYHWTDRAGRPIHRMLITGC